jgi:predicted component of type VI protein secretion system
LTQESLRGLLTRVHEQLAASGSSVDDEARRLLHTVMRDIERALGAGRVEGAQVATAGAAGSPVPRLESLAVRFEAGHPGLAQALRELIDALGKAGI